MSAPRFFVSGVFEPGEKARLDAQDARKLTVVLRATEGAALEIADSSGRIFAATLHLDGDRAYAAIDRVLVGPARPSLRVTLAQGLPKGQKMDFVVEKATELGLERIVAYTSRRTIGEGSREGKLDRWRRLAKSASQQCGRADIPAVDGPLEFDELLASVRSYDVTLVPWELANAGPLHDTLPALIAEKRNALVVIGPEGGLAEEEASALRSAGAHLISLGSRIFRTETAGLVTCSALFYATGDI